MPSKSLFHALFLLFSLFSASHALVEWDFELKFDFLLGLKFKLGTPFQNGGLFVVNDARTPALAVPSVLNQYGYYNPNHSSSFVLTGLATDENGFVNGRTGNETFQIGTHQSTFKNKPFWVIDQEWNYSNCGLLGLARPLKGQSFVQAVLEEEDKEVVTIKYDEVSDRTINGTLYLGVPPTSTCNEKGWKYVQEANYKDDPQIQWAFQLESLSVGKLSIQQPGQALVSIEEKRFSLPSPIFSSVLSALKGYQDGTIPCESKEKIEIRFGDVELNYLPSDYVGDVQPSGRCWFNAENDSFAKQGFILPVSLLRDQCYQLDYENKRIGFGERVRS